MPFISPRSRSNHRGTKDDARPIDSLVSLPYETPGDKSTHDHDVANTSILDSANDTSPGPLLVEVDHGLFMLSQLPTFDNTGLVPNTDQRDLAVLIHLHYCTFQSPGFLPNPEWTWKKATIEIVALRKAFPALKDSGDTLLAMTAWFHFLCNIDDEIEQMDSVERALVLERIIEGLKATSSDQLRITKQTTPTRSVTDIFKRMNTSLHRKTRRTTDESLAVGSHPTAYSNNSGQEKVTDNNLTGKGHLKALTLASNFIQQCQVVLSPQTLAKVFAEVVNYLEALREESAYRESTVLSSVDDYMELRIRTIGLSPFFVILQSTLVGIEAQKAEDFKVGNSSDNKGLPRKDYGTPASDSSDNSSFWTSPLHKSLCDGIKRVVGLQNDIVGLNRDVENGERLNLAALLVEQQNETTENLQAINAARATAVSMHNAEMQHVIRNWADIEAANYSPAVRVYAQSLVGLTLTFYTWSTHTDRYRAKQTSISKLFSSAAQNTAVEGLRFKARVIRTRRSLQKLVASHTM